MNLIYIRGYYTRALIILHFYVPKNLFTANNIRVFTPKAPVLIYTKNAMVSCSSSIYQALAQANNCLLERNPSGVTPMLLYTYSLPVIGILKNQTISSNLTSPVEFAATSIEDCPRQHTEEMNCAPSSVSLPESGSMLLNLYDSAGIGKALW